MSLEVLQDDREERLSIAPAEITDLFFTCKSEFKIQGYISAYTGHEQR